SGLRYSWWFGWVSRCTRIIGSLLVGCGDGDAGDRDGEGGRGFAGPSRLLSLRRRRSRRPRRGGRAWLCRALPVTFCCGDGEAGRGGYHGRELLGEVDGRHLDRARDQRPEAVRAGRSRHLGARVVRGLEAVAGDPVEAAVVRELRHRDRSELLRIPVRVDDVD